MHPLLFRSRPGGPRLPIAGSLRAALWPTLLLLVALVVPASASRRVVDGAGRTLTLPDRPHRIVCLAPSIADTLFALGAADDVAAVTDYTLYPPEARNKTSIGQPLRPSLERIAVLHPDLAIGISTFNDADTIRGIQRLGIPVFLVDPSGLAGLYRSIDEIGRALNRPAEASALVARLQAREQAVRSQAAQREGGSAQSSRRPTVFVALALDPCITAGGGAFLTELLTAAGADSVTADFPQAWVRLSLEAVLRRQPDFVLVIRDVPFGLEQMRNRPGWRSLEAVRAGRLLRIDDRLQYPSPTAFDALEAFAKQLHAAERPLPADSRPAASGHNETLHGEHP